MRYSKLTFDSSLHPIWNTWVHQVVWYLFNLKIQCKHMENLERDLTKQLALPMAVIVIIMNARVGLMTQNRLFYKIVTVIFFFPFNLPLL